MLIKKIINGHIIVLEYRRVKKYRNRFTLYRVYKRIGKSKRIFLYNTCLTDLQLKEIVKRKYLITEEVFV